MIHWSTAGESHGRALVALLEGLPAGVAITSADIAQALARRRLGSGRGARQKFEQDKLTVIAGIRHGFTMGSPIALQIANTEWPKWRTVMAPDPVSPAELQRPAGKGETRELARNMPLTAVRPGHADLAGMNKFGYADARPVLERASARETAARVALGAVAGAYIAQAAGVTVTASVTQIGRAAQRADAPLVTPDQQRALDASDVRNLDPQLAEQMRAEIAQAQQDGDTLGGIVEVVAWNVPQGIGTYTVAAQRLDAQLAAAMMSIPAVKAVAIGDGFAQASMRGSQAQDEIVPDSADKGIHRLSNHAGGIEGGMANGEPIVVRAAIKPIPTVPRALRTIDAVTGAPATAAHQRSDTTAVVPGAIVAEAMMKLVLAQALSAKFGGDSLPEVQRNITSYLAAIAPGRRR